MTAKADILASLRADIASIEHGGSASRPTAGVRQDRVAEEEAGRSIHVRGCRRPPAAPGAGSAGEGSGFDAGATGKETGADCDDGKTAEEAFRKILRWASARERSTAYVRDRLARDEFPAEAIEEAVGRACRVHALDDRRYADALVRATLSAGRGLRRAEEEIRALGIEPDTLDAWAEHAEAGREADVSRALEVLRRRPPRARAAREAAFRKLVGRGYPADVASTAARLWFEESQGA